MPDEQTRQKVLEQELMTLGNHVELLISEQDTTEEDKDCFW